MIPALIVYGLSVWRLTHMVTRESGPLEVFTSLRELAARDDVTEKLANCPSCASVWIAGILLVSPWWLRLLLAGSAASKLIEDYFYAEEEEEEEPYPVETLSQVHSPTWMER